MKFKKKKKTPDNGNERIESRGELKQMGCVGSTFAAVGKPASCARGRSLQESLGFGFLSHAL